MNNKPKLELTWIGKDEQPKLEPRILIEDPEKSYGDKNTENMLIYGDNLLALKALEHDFTGKIKCIYIDPPFNTGAAFENYDDSLEHSIWLKLMYERLNILNNLLSPDGSIFVHLDDNEVDYCKLIMDEIFHRDNLVNRISIEARSPSAFSTVNPGVFKASEYLLWYAKDKLLFENRSLRIPSSRNQAYNKFAINKTDNIENWKFNSLKMAFLEDLNSERLAIIQEFVKTLYENRNRFNKKSLMDYYINNFKYHSMTKVSQVVNYFWGKLKIDSYTSFYEYTYPYLLNKCTIAYSENDLDDFVINNASSVFRETEISDDGAGEEIVKLKYLSLEKSDKVFKLVRSNGLDDVYIRNGKQLSFYDKNVMLIEGNLVPTELLTNIWTDISWEGIANEGKVKFKKGKKPERLIQRCLLLASNEGDYVLDSFLGSGTTSAVANKMNRKWIGIELGEHCHTHCIPRLEIVCDGTDQSGISKAIDWQGGGGFKYYYLAPSLLRLDKYGNWIIEEKYNANMLAAAMAKHNNFKYQPSEEVYWKQGQSTEKDFIYTTTQFITVEKLDQIHEEMQAEESLLICCKKYSKPCENRYSNITIKKIPQMLLGKCEFGREDYSLNIISMPGNESEKEFVPKGPQKKKIVKDKSNTPDLFEENNGEDE
jgi:adenine-specific DNA-methyltransferase